MKIIRVFTKDHLILDELSEFNDLTYTWTLNGMGKSEFNIPLSSSKCTELNLRFRNHVEIIDESNNIVWGGQIVQIEFQDNKVHISCYGYLSLFWKRRLRSTAYPQMSYGSLLQTMITDTNTIADTGVTIGNIANGSLFTQRNFTNTDILIDKMTELIGDCNNDMEVDNNRKFNFYLKKGTEKPYILQYGTDADNILVSPSLSRGILNSGNSIYSECTVNSSILSSTATDQISNNTYGLIEDVLSAPSGVMVQDTLSNAVNGALQREAYPINSITLSIRDSELCPFNDISVGDSVMIYLRPYWEFKENLRILEMTHDESNGNRSITVGQSIYRKGKPIIKIYSE